jgi:arsenate reductase
VENCPLPATGDFAAGGGGGVYIESFYEINLYRHSNNDSKQQKQEEHMSTTIYHNPKCSKSREALEFLRSKGIEPTIIEYLKNPPSAATLKEIIGNLTGDKQAIVRKNESLYKKLGIDDKKLKDNDIADLLTGNPTLIERPIVIVGKKAAIGRPLENILDILP